MRNLGAGRSVGTRWSARLLVGMVIFVLAVQWSAGPATAAYDSSTTTSHSATVKEAYELSGLVASPTYPNWYWTHSDVWESTDVYAACQNLSGTALSQCQQVQRARIWALKIDPVTRAVVASRSFYVENPAWATDPFIAENNDWEGISLGPSRDGSGQVNLVIGATGNADGNRVYDDSGRDITCETRRLIELQEPNLADASVTTWRPWKIYDLKNIIGVSGLKSCNVETLIVAPGAEQTAYVVTKTLRKLFARSLDETTGRDPETPPAPADSSLPYRPAATYVGNVRDATGMKITAGDANQASVSMLVPKTATKPCRILTWDIRSGSLGTTLTQYSPTIHVVTCGSQAEGLAYNRTAVAPSSTNDLVAVADANSSSRSKFLYWYLPAG